MIGQEQLALTGSILQEILQTYRDDETASAVARQLRPYPLLEVDRETSTEAANLHRRCAARGIAASTIDCQIAAAALRHDYALLTADSDFGFIARVCALELL
jgi:predicted nucleic acid-binding protein